ncbi:hypothetical protein ONZ45_g14951 [Pleurotus djamor]|nr:hypothetical protein ONZ45_g14951 [Pleurotus djamor]
MQTITRKFVNEDGTVVYTSLTLASAPYRLNSLIFKGYTRNYVFTNDCTFDAHAAPFEEAEDGNDDDDGVKNQPKTISLHSGNFVVKHENAVLDASGRTASTSDDPNGIDGGQIHFSSSNFDVGHPIKLNCRGGNGFNMLSSEKIIDGGDGGNGGTIKLFCADTYLHLLNIAITWFKLKDEREKKNARRSWVNELQRIITYPPSLTRSIDKLDDAITKSDDFERSTEELVDAVCAGLQAASDRFLASNVLDVDGGFYGVGSGGGRNGKAGTMGEARLTSMRLKSRASSTMIFIHPDQVAMTIRDIEDDYFLGTDEALLRCGAALEELIRRINFFDSLTEEHALYQAYVEQEAEYFVLHPDPGVSTSVPSIQDSLKKAKNYALQLSQGLDFYGHRRGWVPRGSFHFYKDYLKELIDAHGDIETNYWYYKDANLSQAKRIEAIQVGQDKALHIIRRAESDMAYYVQDLQTTQTLIAALTDPLPYRRIELLEAIKKAAEEINDTLSVTLANFVKVVTAIITAPGISGRVITGIGSILEGVDAISKTKIERKYILKKIEVITGDLKGIEHGLKVIEDGTYQIDDPGATKLLMEEEKLMEIIEEYRNLLKAATVQHIKSKFDNYVKAVLIRNNALVHYNMDIVLYQEAEADLSIQERQLAILARTQLEKVDLELPSIAAYVEQSFFATTSQILRMVYRTQRALAFYALQPDLSYLSDLRGKGFRRRGISAALKSAKVHIYAAYETATTSFPSHRQNFGYHKNDQSSGDPITVTLDQSELEALKADKEVLVAIHAALADTKKEHNSFAGLADVRVSNLRVYMEGAQTADNVLTILIEHLGQETIVNSSGKPLNFHHDPLTFQFRYSLVDRKNIQIDGDLSDEFLKEYAPPGPFTSWRLRVVDAHNMNVDLSGLTRCWFEFSGSARAFTV